MKFKAGDEVLIKARIKDMSYVDTMYVCELVTNPDVCIRFKSPAECIVTDKTYEMGLNDAWELAKKIGALKNPDFDKVFGCVYYADVFCNFTYEEALAKIEAYEKEKEIKVGDVVYYSKDGEISMQSIVTRIEGDVVYTVYSDGSCGREYYPNDLKKTGKHIDIESLLRQIGE